MRTPPVTATGVLLVAACCLLLAMATQTDADPDLWGHVRFGRDIAADRILPSIDPYSFTQDRTWLNHEWLSELQMGLAWQWGGAAGLAVLKGGLTFAALAAIWGAFAGMEFARRVTAMAASVVATASLTQTLRPQLWSLLALVIVGRLLGASRRSARWWLPLLFAVWANLHGGWVVGFGTIGAWAVAESWIDKTARTSWAALLPVCLLATLATPHGLALWQFLAETVRLARPNIEEWRPLWTFGPEQWLPWAAALAAGVWMIGRSEVSRGARVLPLAGLAFASIEVVRIVPLFAALTAVFVAPSLARRWPAGAAAAPVVASGDRWAVIALAVLAFGTAGWVGSRSLACVAVDQDRMPERAPVRLIRPVAGARLVTFFNWGEYAIWHLGPDVRVSMDGRRETVYSDARLAEHDGILAGSPAGLATLDAWQPEYVWLPASSVRTREWLMDRGYRLRHDTARSFVAVRGDLAGPEALSFTETGGARCFPD